MKIVKEIFNVKKRIFLFFFLIIFMKKIIWGNVNGMVAHCAIDVHPQKIEKKCHIAQR